MAEGALNLEDYWVRRSARAHFDVQGGLADLEATADLMATFLEWTEAEKVSQIQLRKEIRADEMRHLQVK